MKGGGPDKFLLGIVVVTVLILAGVFYFGSKAGATSEVVADSQISMAITENEFDWGEIDINGGVVSKAFAIENQGDQVLKLHGVKTSCMCTTAQLKTASKTSKKFGMHERSGDVFEVQPGETAELLVEFDPAFHGPSGVGAISRTITMNTNDAENPTLSFQLAANVVRK
jgi:hypothetical protein